MLVCPDCDKTTLKIIEKIELGPDDYADENARQLLHCSSCGTNAVGIYDESRRGARDRFHHYGFRIDDKALEKLRQVMSGKSKSEIKAAFGGHTDWSREFKIEHRAQQTGFFESLGMRIRRWVKRLKNTLTGDPNAWGWFEPDGSIREETGDDELIEIYIDAPRMIDDRLRGHKIPNPYGTGKSWISKNEARLRPSTGTWHLFYKDPISSESVLMHVPEIQKEIEGVWQEQQALEQEREALERQERIIAADLDGRLPKDGEMYRGLGLYLCRNLMEDHARAGDDPGWDYDITLTPDGLFEHLSPTDPNPNHKDKDFPLEMGGHCTRYRGITAAMEALAQLMETHGNKRHAKEFREAVKDVPVKD